MKIKIYETTTYIYIKIHFTPALFALQDQSGQKEQFSQEIVTSIWKHSWKLYSFEKQMTPRYLPAKSG